MDTRCFLYLDKVFIEVVNHEAGTDKNEEKDLFPAFT